MRKGTTIICIILFLAFSNIPLFAVKAKRAKEIELTLWHSMSIYQGGALEKLVDEYNNTHDDVHVNPIFQGLYDEMKIKLINALKTGDTPDIAQVAIEYLDVFIADEKIEPLNDVVSEEDKNDVLSQFWEGVSRNRNIYAIPFNQSVQVLYYNKSAFENAGLDPEKPPKTWEDVIEYGNKLTHDINGDNEIDQWGVLISMEGVFGFTPLIRQTGGEFLNDDRTQALFNSEAGVKVMKLIQDMVYTHGIMPSNWTLFEGANAFLGGKIAMGPITCAGIKYAEENLPWELGIAPLPYIENKSVLLGGAGLVIFAKQSYKRKASLHFIQWLTNRENSIRWHKETGYLPLRKSALESIELRSFHRDNPNYKVPVDQLPYSRPPDFTPVLSQIDQVVRFAIEDIMINKQDPQQVLNSAVIKVNGLLEEEKRK
ncbi:MAG: ABC transporter substrate-binding protein [Spirochaetota bacterium]|nr:MAG: ABC transporter substrate-binding protein [Spirochaetota bacterium]